MTLLRSYEKSIVQGDIIDDPRQRQVLSSLQTLADELKKPNSFWKRWHHKRRAIKGVYLHGPVGVGKTYLMDLFYHQVHEEKKARFHFHHFMQQVDRQLRQLQGQQDPLQRLALNLSKQIRLLCLDEFLVHDIAHAMILAELLQALLAHNIVLIATSNTPPDELYLHGVQRTRFLPAIELIKKHCLVLSLGEQCDYRLGRQPSLSAYLYPLNAATESKFAIQFENIEPHAEEKGSISIQNRAIPFVKCGKTAVWFDFSILCNLPRSQLDYLEIAERFDTVFVSNIPKLDESSTIHTILLVHFIDVMYDRGIRLIVSAATPPAQLYEKGEMSQTFKRTLSRLEEMQSADYLKRHPRRALQQFQD